jgi:hypothetical protein
VKESDIVRQSKQAYGQWAPQWRKHAKYHSKMAMHSMEELRNSGIGKAVLCIANGYSFEKNIDIIKKYQDNVDIVACDKTLLHCLENGIKPKYVVMCDANVSSEKYLDKYRDQLKDIVLISNVCGNITWTDPKIWKKIYFFVNRDVLKSEQEFSALSGCKNFIIAGTNVSNAMVIVLTQCDERGTTNFFNYDRILLIGYDYSWNDSYYAFDKKGGGKINYMRTVTCNNFAGKLSFTSTNLLFSAQWFEKFVKTYHIPISQCTKDTIVLSNHYSDLAKSMQYSHKPEDKAKVFDLNGKRAKIINELALIENELKNISKDHYLAYLSSK